MLFKLLRCSLLSRNIVKLETLNESTKGFLQREWINPYLINLRCITFSGKATELLNSPITTDMTEYSLSPFYICMKTIQNITQINKYIQPVHLWNKLMPFNILFLFRNPSPPFQMK